MGLELDQMSRLMLWSAIRNNLHGRGPIDGSYHSIQYRRQLVLSETYARPGAVRQISLQDAQPVDIAWLPVDTGVRPATSLLPSVDREQPSTHNTMGDATPNKTHLYASFPDWPSNWMYLQSCPLIDASPARSTPMTMGGRQARCSWSWDSERRNPPAVHVVVDAPPWLPS